MIEANDFYSTKDFSYYLADYFKKDQKKMLEMLNDSSSFVELALNPSIKNTIKTLKILKKYFPGELKSNLHTVMGMTLLLKIANTLVKKDYEEQIERALVLAKKRGF